MTGFFFNYIFHQITFSSNCIFHQITFSIKFHFSQYSGYQITFFQITFFGRFCKNRLILLLCYFVENPRLRIYPQIIPKNLEESFEGEVVIHVQQITLFKKTFAKKKCSFLQVLENP